MTKIQVSKCCKASIIEDEQIINGESKDLNTCYKCKKECEIEEVCETCLGTGEVDVMEYVYPGEPHMAPIDTGRCPDCYSDESDFDNSDND